MDEVWDLVVENSCKLATWKNETTGLKQQTELKKRGCEKGGGVKVTDSDYKWKMFHSPFRFCRCGSMQDL